jgi:hypothetical protein
MQLKTIATLAMLLIFFSAFSQKKELKTITGNELKAHLEFIASDFMQGRDFGTPIPGLEIAAAYLKSQCLDMGLTPASPGFSQPVKITQIKADPAKTAFRLKNTRNEIAFTSADLVTFPGSVKTDTISGEIVFAGYGWQNKDKGYSDLDSLEFKDKVVLIMTRNPMMKTDSASDLMGSSQTEMAKLGPLLMGGAKAVIFIPDPLNPDRKWFDLVKEYAGDGSYSLEGENAMQVPGNILFANIETANEILKETGKTLQQIQLEINQTMKPASCIIKEVKAEIILAKTVTPVIGENIVAVVEGSDPMLKNEYVILTAHYDHVGISPTGEVNNGADDNGSGTVTLLEVAEAFMSMEKKPKRSIVFLWVTAEEKGLLGSHYYTMHPLFPMEKTVANINLDMVGRSAEKEAGPLTDLEKSLAGPNGVYLITSKGNKEINEIGTKISSQLKLMPSDELSEDFLNGSDYFHFYNQGIPILGISTGLHEDYHHPTDDFTKIDYNKMKRMADLTFLVTLEIANRKTAVDDNPTGK